jgi:hypothetical protein
MVLVAAAKARARRDLDNEGFARRATHGAA